MDSDSDEDLLPNFNTFNAMFSKVQRQARQEVPVPTPSSSTKPSKKTKSGKKVDGVEKSSHGKTSGSSKDKSKDSNSKKQKEIEISDDTKSLLAEVENLTKPVYKSEKSPDPVPVLPSHSVGSKSSKRGTRRSKGNLDQKTVMEDIIHLSDEDDGIEVLDATFESFNENDVMEVEPVEEFCTLRIRWKQEVMRFRVPREAKMSRVRMELAERVTTRADNLVILDEANSEEISDNTSVESIPFGKTFEAFEREIVNNNSTLKAKSLDPSLILIRLQGCGGYRERCTVCMKRTTHVKQLVEDYIEKYGFHGKQFKLVFDGEDVDFTETPESLDLENNDMVDVVEI